jgi:hypothetical protein
MKPYIKKHRLNQLGAVALAAICLFYTGCRRESDSTVKQSEPTPAETDAAATLDLAGYQKRGGGVVIPNPPSVNSQFDEGSKGWTLPQGAELKSSEGRWEVSTSICIKKANMFRLSRAAFHRARQVALG